MPVKQYEIEGQLYNVSEAREADFLNDFKDKQITLVSDGQEEKIDPLVKITDGAAGAGVPLRNVEPAPTMESQLESGFSVLSDLDSVEQVDKPEDTQKTTSPFESYKNKLKSLITEDDELDFEDQANAAPEVINQNMTYKEYRESGLMDPNEAKYYQGSGSKRVQKTIYPYSPFLKQARSEAEETDTEQDIIDAAKKLFISDKRRQTLQLRGEEVLEEFEKEFYTPLDRVKKIGALGLKQAGLLLDLPIDFRIKADKEYDQAREQALIDLKQEDDDKRAEVNKKISTAQTHAAITESAIEKNAWYRKLIQDGIELTEEEKNDFLYNQNVAKTAFEIYNTSIKGLSDDIIEIENFSTITDLTKRTYNNLDVASNRVGATVMNLLAGLGTLADEFSVKSLVENFANLDLKKTEDLKLVPQQLRPIVSTLANIQEKVVDITAGELYENARNLNENTKLRQEMGKISSIEDFLEFGLDLFSEQAVNTAVTAGTGGIGLALVSASAGGQKMNEMNIELENGVKISPWQYYGAGIMYAGGEFISERVSMRQFNRMLGSAVDKTFKISDDLVIEPFKFSNAFKKYGSGLLEEGNAELFAQLSNNAADKYLLNKDVAITDGLGEAFLTGAFMSGLGFGAPTLAVDLHRAFSSDKVLQDNNVRLKKILNITKEINKLSSIADTDPDAKSAIIELQQQQDALYEENIQSMQSVHSLVDNLSNEDKRLLLDLDAQAYKYKRGIDKINSNKKLSPERKKQLIEDLSKNVQYLNSYKQEIINSSDYSIDKELARKTQASIRAVDGSELEIISAEDANDAKVKGFKFIDNSNLEAEDKTKLKNKLANILEGEGVDAHGWEFGAEEGLPMTFQLKSNATDGNYGNSTVFSHELAHATVFKKLIEGNADIISLIEDFQSYVSKRFKGAKEVFDKVEETYAGKSKEVIAEEKFVAIKDMFRKYKLQPDKTFQGKILDKWNKITKGDKKPPVTEIKTGQDVFDLMISFASSFNKGEIDGLAKDVIGKKVKAIQKKPKSLKDTKPKEIDKESVANFSKNKAQEDSKTKQILDSFTGPAENRKYKTKAEFEASTDYVNAYEYFLGNELDARINSVAAGKGVDFIDVQKVKDNLALRFVQNFDVGKNSLFGWMLGKTPALNFAVLDVIKEETAKTPTVTTTTAEGGTIDVVDDVSIEDQIDMAMTQQKEAPRSALKQELRKEGQPFVDQALEDAIETNTIEIFEGAKPEFTDVDLVPFLKQASQQKSFKQIKNKIGDAMKFLKDNDNYKTLFYAKNLPVSVLVAMERKVPVANRIFTGEPTRLTTQEQIDKAVNEGDFYVENEKTGPSKYPRKKPTIEQLNKFFNVPTINPQTGKRSGLKGTRKDGLVNAVSFGLFRDITPSVMRKLDKPQAEIAKTAEKLVVDPDIKFSLSNLKLNENNQQKLFNILKLEGLDSKKAISFLNKINIPKNQHDIIIGDIISEGIVAQMQEIEAANMGIKYEKALQKVVNTFTDTKINVSLNKKRKGDLKITVGKNVYLVEVKLNDKAQIGSASIGVFSVQNGNIVLKNLEDLKISQALSLNNKIEFDEFIKNKNSQDYLSNLINAINKVNNNLDEKIIVNKTGHLKLPNKDIWQDIKNEMPNNKGGFISYESNESIVEDFYKNVDLIQIGGYGSYSIGQDSKLKNYYEVLSAKTKNTFRPVRSGQTVYMRLFPSFITINNEKSNSLDTSEGINKLGNSVNNQIKFSKSLNTEFNKIIERSTKGKISATSTISEARAKARGAKKGKFDFFVSPSAEDFVGLLYKTLGKGKQGDADLQFYKTNLLDPFARADRAITSERIALISDYNAIKKQIGIVPKNLRKKLPGEDFTREQAVRVYIWTKQGMTVPGLSEGDINNLLAEVQKSPELITFGNQLIMINKGDGYAKPDNNWLSGSITTDLLQGLNTVKRAKYLQEWQNNVDIIFSKENLNKLEAAYGTQYRKALENMLLRMKTGRNRTYGPDSLTGKVTDFINGSVGAIMFFNTRSAVLQVLSATNFINFKDNNIFAAGKAFANQKQYWKDFIELFNSEFLLARRDGLQLNVNEADIAEMAKKGGVRGIINELLRIGFTPTQLADSFAIASGGATFYRNRLKAYEKQVDNNGNNLYTKEEAQKKAFNDFKEVAEESQQSSRPDKISQQQAGPLGRLILAFANTPSQYARIIKKATLDLKNKRGDAKTNISKIVYYTFAQNLLFNALQQGIFALAFDDDDEIEELSDKENEKRAQKVKNKQIDLANGMANSLLRGMGLYGATTAAVKDAAIRIYKESEKKQPKYEKAAIDFLNISPPISSKYRKIASAGRIMQYEGDQVIQKGIALDNPALAAGSRVVSATTNIPLDRLVTKAENINGALNQDVEYWQSIAMLLGWQDWQLGIEDNKDEEENANAAGGFEKFKIKEFKIKKF